VRNILSKKKNSAPDDPPLDSTTEARAQVLRAEIFYPIAEAVGYIRNSVDLTEDEQAVILAIERLLP